MKNLKEAGEEGFVINIPSKDYLEEFYYLGIHSGAEEENKVDNAGLSLRDSEELDVPKIKNVWVGLNARLRTKLKKETTT